MTKLSVRLSTVQGKEIGSTSRISQRASPVWNESIYAVYDVSSPIVSVGLLHHLQDQKEYLYSFGNLSIQGLIAGQPVKMQVHLGGDYGVVEVQCEILHEQTTALSTLVRWMCMENESKMIQLMVDQV